MKKTKKHVPAYILLFLGISVLLIWYALYTIEARGSHLRVSFFDVGQGDAIFIETPDGNQALIDGGPSNAILNHLGRAMPFWDRSLDAIILTHPDQDHITGAVEALRRYQVDLIFWTGVDHSSAVYREWLRLLDEKSPRIAIARAGQRVNIGRGVFFDVFSPHESQEGKKAQKINNTSTIGKLRYGEVSFLLTGDAEKQVERRLVFEYGDSLDSDILKAGHHGSKTSSAEEFLRAVSPDVVIIQAGRKNRFGHPHEEVLDRFSAIGASIFRNDVSGNITVESDGIEYSIKN